MQATQRVLSSSTDSVQVLTVPVALVPGIAVELEGILAAEKRLGRLAVQPTTDIDRLIAEFGSL